MCDHANPSLTDFDTILGFKGIAIRSDFHYISYVTRVVYSVAKMYEFHPECPKKTKLNNAMNSLNWPS